MLLKIELPIIKNFFCLLQKIKVDFTKLISFKIFEVNV